MSFGARPSHAPRELRPAGGALARTAGPVMMGLFLTGDSAPPRSPPRMRTAIVTRSLEVRSLADRSLPEHKFRFHPPRGAMQPTSSVTQVNEPLPLGHGVGRRVHSDQLGPTVQPRRRVAGWRAGDGDDGASRGGAALEARAVSPRRAGPHRGKAADNSSLANFRRRCRCWRRTRFEPGAAGGPAAG